VEKLRNRQIKNFLTVTMLSLGLPMIVMGDEVRRTQLGNNNGYCIDNETVWFDWTLLAKHTDVHRFVRLLIARRLMRGLEHEHQTLVQWLREAVKAWHGVKLDQPDWSPGSHSLALNVKSSRWRWVPLDPECLLGAARIRTTAPNRRRRVAPLDRYLIALSARHRSLENIAAGLRANVPCGGTLGRRAHHRGWELIPENWIHPWTRETP